jgi:hypothetical protein
MTHRCTTCGRFCYPPAQGPYGDDYDPYCEEPCLQNAWEEQEERRVEYDPPTLDEQHLQAWHAKHGNQFT